MGNHLYNHLASLPHWYEKKLRGLMYFKSKEYPLYKTCLITNFIEYKTNTEKLWMFKNKINLIIYFYVAA